MSEILPWLIGAWLVFGRRPAPAQSSTSKPAPSSTPPRTAPRVAYLYQLPDDGYETVRVSVSNQPDAAIDNARPIEMGIFSNEANALALVHSKGWALAWPGVKQLPDRP